MKYNEQTSQIIRAAIIRYHLKKYTIRAIAKNCNCSTRTVLKWVDICKNLKEQDNKNDIYKDPNTEAEKNEEDILKEINKIDLKRKIRKGKSTIPRKVKNYIFKKWTNKTTGGKDNSSIRKIVAIGNKKYKLNKDPKHKLTIGKVQRFLIKCFGKPRKLKKRPILKESHYKQKKNFAKYIIENDIDHKKIYFTDEKRFLLNFAPNPQNNQIRLTKESKKLFKKNNDKINKLMTIELEKHPKGIMVAGGVSSYWVGKLNFCVGTMNSFSYKQTLQN